MFCSKSLIRGNLLQQLVLLKGKWSFFSTASLNVSSWKTAYLQWAHAHFKKIFLDDQIIVLT